MSIILLNKINIPNAPEIPGLKFRGYQGDSDYPIMALVNRECNKVDQVEFSTDADYLRCRYTHMVNCDLDRDILFAEVDRDVIGYSRVCWRQELDGTRVYEHVSFLKPAWREHGIGWTMLKYNQQRLQEISSTHPQDGNRVYESFVGDTEQIRKSMLIKDGYIAVRYFFEMVRPDLENIPEAAMPDGLEVRPVLPEHYQAIYEASKEAFRDHWGYSEEWESTIAQWLDDPSFDPSLWRVAWAGDQVAGMVRSFIDRNENEEYNRKRGWTEDISVRRPWRRRGLARSLLVQSLYALKERGMIEAALGVDTNNQQDALKLYQGVGFDPVKQFSAYQKPFSNFTL